ncbi:MULTISPECIES: hypothetical protein [unclassified Nocardioides]|uniref:hypothetical protein n=1 Tax=unclassified Nocardioides TaxID=2615069 RepID=UPI00361BC26B
MGEHRDQHTPASEYGGADGLIQPEPHPMTPSEANTAIVRAGMYGDTLDGDVVVDPATGHIVPPELNRPA